MHRRVRRLRLTCAREEDARHGRVLLDDALRTATLREEGRLIVVRRFDLGRIPSRASATQWSRRIEETFRRTHAEPVRFDRAGAAQARSVYFDDCAAPWFAVARRTALREPLHDWFWPAALHGWNPRDSPAETLRLCVRTLAGEGGLRLTLQLAAELHAIDALAALLRVLRANDLAAAQNEIGCTPSTLAPTAPRTLALRQYFAPLTGAEIACLRAWGPHDLRTRWLAAWVVSPAPSPRSLVPVAGVSALHLNQQIERWTRSDLWTSSTPVPPHDHVDQPPCPASRSHPATATEAARAEKTVPEAGRTFTRAGGLFFVLPLLVRAGLPAFLSSLPGEESVLLPWQILRLTLVHSRIPEIDPLVVALRKLPPPPPTLGRWLIATNRHARRLVRMSLRQLVTRPALITFSATHVDLFFRPREADVHIRRAALDLDPGWVPWLGRVITFHYDRED